MRPLVGKTIDGCLLAVALMMPTAAEASTFTLKSYDVALHTSGSGLQVWEKDLLPEPFTFDLSQVGETISQELFVIGTKESDVDLDDWFPYSIAVAFAFSEPAPGFGGSSLGLTGAVNFFGHEFGYVVWDNPLKLAFGTTGLLEVVLSNAVFGVPGSAQVSATFKLAREDSRPATSVPEPATAVLLATGLVLAARRGGRKGSKSRPLVS